MLTKANLMHGAIKPAQIIDSRDWLLLVVLSVIWGGSFLFVGIAIKEVPPLTIVFLRVGIAALVLTPLVFIRHIPFPRGWAAWRIFIVMAILNNIIPFSLQAVAQYYIASGLASVLNALTPLFTVLVMASFREERLVARRLAGVVMGLVGVIVLREPSLDLATSQGIGIGLCLLATLSYGFSALWAKRKMAGLPPIGAATFQMMMASIMMGALSFAIDRPWQLPMPSLSALVAIVSLAVVASAIGFVIFFKIIERSGPSNVMLVTLLVPVSAILLGHVVLDEVIHTREYLGALIIGAALLVMDGRLFDWIGRRALNSR